MNLWIGDFQCIKVSSQITIVVVEAVDVHKESEIWIEGRLGEIGMLINQWLQAFEPLEVAPTWFLARATYP